MLTVSLLGDFSIRRDGAPVAHLDTSRLQALLAYLLLHRDAPQSRAYLAYLFWPDTTEGQARTNLRNLLHYLRRALPDADSYLDISAQTLQWRSDAPLALDVADFEAALAQAEQAGRAGAAAAAQAALERAVALYRGDLLPSCYDDWIIPCREGLRQAYLNGLERLVQIVEGQRDYATAIGYAQRLLRHDPLHEATYRHLIRLHALNGDRASALRAYHACATILGRELGVEPSTATREAYEQLLRAGPWPSPRLPDPTAVLPLVGRGREWARMLGAWRAVVAGGGPHLVMLCGEAGIGKTRLAEELLQWAIRQGITGAHARCYASEGALAYAPVAAWLRAHPVAPLGDVWLTEVARLLPEISAGRPDLPRPGPLTEAWQRERLFEALVRAVLGLGQPLLLVMDDLQWCDRDTAEWLHFLLRFDRGARLLVVGAYRPEETGEGHPLGPLLEALRVETQATEIDLGPLDEAAASALAERIAGREMDMETTRLLYRETEGVPLFVVETVRAGLLVRAGETDAGIGEAVPLRPMPGAVGLPPKVQAVLQARLAQLSRPARELAEVAATIGREFATTLLAHASGRAEGTLVHQLDELWRRRIVREHGTDAYDFSHDKLREVAYAGMSGARRRLLHHQVARALERLHAADPDPVSHQVAAHYERAGFPEQAAPYYLRAARVARKVYANAEAIALLRRGLALLDNESDAGREARSHQVLEQLWEELGDVLALTAQYEEALQAYRKGREHVPHGDRMGQSRLYRKAGVVMREQRLYAEALEACKMAEGVLGEPPDQDGSDWWAEWLEVQVDRVWAHYWLAQWPEMEALVSKVQPVVQSRGGASSRMRLLWASCLMHLRKYRYVVSDEMLADAREALALSQVWGDLTIRVYMRFELGFLLLWRRELEEAEEHLLVALELAETSGMLPQRTLALTYLTVLSRFQGQSDRVSDYSLRAQESAVAAQMPDYVAVARGNQSWLAWRRGDLSAAGQLGRQALAQWQRSPLVYPFQWQALWPLLGVSLAQGHEDEAWTCAEALLKPAQQRLPDALNGALEAAVEARAEGRDEAARAHLEHATELARALGYL